MEPDTEADMEPDTEVRSLWQAGFVVLIAFTVLVALVTFALSFYGLEDFGRTGMGLPHWLSPLVPLGVDLFSVCGIAATYLLRFARARVRAYAWFVFLVPTLLSVAGNMAHAAHRNLGGAGIVGAAVAPVVLALSAHLVVVVRRHMERADTEPDTDIGPLAQVSAPPAPGVPDSEKVAAMARALAVRSEGGTLTAQAAAAGVDERTVRRWFGQPQRRPATRRSTPARTARAERANGAVPSDGNGETSS